MVCFPGWRTLPLALNFLLLWPVVEAITTRTVWLDKTCKKQLDGKQVTKDQSWDIVRAMKNAGLEAAQGNPDWNLYDWIFKDESHANTDIVKDALNAIADNMASSRDTANTIVYCDNDAHWKKANEGKENYMDSYWTEVKFKGTPFCTQGQVNNKLVNGYSQCQDQLGDGKCIITICDRAFKGKFVSLKNLDAKVLAKGNVGDRNGPEIDNFILFESTLLHEIIHGIKNPRTAISDIARPGTSCWSDIDYRWKGVTSLSQDASLLNVDSLAYLGFVNHIQLNAKGGPYSIKEDGRIYQKAD